MKTNHEKSIEALTWAAVVIWLGFALIMRLLGYVWLVLMVLSIILLTSAIYQRSRGWHTSLTIWIAGVWMAVFSVIEVVNELLGALNDGEGLEIDLWVYLGIALISMGLAVVLRNLQGPQIRTTGSQAGEGRAPIVPSQLQDDMSKGYLPPDGEPRIYGRARPQPPPAPRPIPEGPPRTGRRERRRARPAGPVEQQPDDLESRVEDIIRRSRERRDRDNLPY